MDAIITGRGPRYTQKLRHATSSCHSADAVQQLPLRELQEGNLLTKITSKRGC